jgi:benzodiazapine receptor
MDTNIDNKSWYRKLKKSKLTPPGWTFGVVWPLLYASLIIYFFLIYLDHKCHGICEPLPFFLVQIVLNLAWPVTFFQLREIKMSFIYIVLMVILTFITIVLTKSNIKYILVPYFCWISFATYLNGYIALYN